MNIFLRYIVMVLELLFSALTKHFHICQKAQFYMEMGHLKYALIYGTRQVYSQINLIIIILYY